MDPYLRPTSTRSPPCLRAFTYRSADLGRTGRAGARAGEARDHATGGHHGTDATRSHVLPLAQDGRPSAGGGAGLRRASGAGGEWKEGRPRRRRHRPALVRLRSPSREARLPERRKRAAPFRLERVQLAPLRLRAQPAHGAALPRAAGHGQLAHSRRGHRAGLAPTPPREGDRGGGGDGEDGLLRAPHRALRSRRALHERTRRHRRRRAGRHLHAGSRDVRGARQVGARPRPAVPRLRLRLAPGSGRDDHERAGDAEHGEGRREPRAAPRGEVRPRAARLGSATAHPPADARAGRRAADGARAASGARPPAELWLRGCLPQPRRPVECDLHLVSRREEREVGDTQGDRDPRRAGGPDAAPAAAPGVQGRAAAGHGHQPLARRPIPVRELLGHRRAAPVRRQRPLRPEAHRHPADRWDRTAGAAPEER